MVGKAGVGKTAIRRPLAIRLKARGIGPDDHPRRWDWAVVQLDRTRRVVLECCQIPRAVRARMGPQTVVVELTANDQERKRRLGRQGHDPEEIARRLAGSSNSIGWEDAVRPDFTVDTSTSDPEGVADHIAKHTQARWQEQMQRA